MLVILFRSKLTAAAGQDYADTNADLAEYVKTMPGFVAVKSFLAEDGERLTLVWWRDKESLAHWRHDARHQAAQIQGRQQWYEYYKIEVAEVLRQNDFERPAAPAVTAAGEGR